MEIVQEAISIYIDVSGMLQRRYCWLYRRFLDCFETNILGAELAEEFTLPLPGVKRSLLAVQAQNPPTKIAATVREQYSDNKLDEANHQDNRLLVGYF